MRVALAQALCLGPDLDLSMSMFGISGPRCIGLGVRGLGCRQLINLGMQIQF